MKTALNNIIFRATKSTSSTLSFTNNNKFQLFNKSGIQNTNKVCKDESYHNFMSQSHNAENQVKFFTTKPNNILKAWRNSCLGYTSNRNQGIREMSTSSNQAIIPAKIGRKFPIGISDLKEIIKNGYPYADKSDFVHLMLSRGKYYFLSRPRRFGKSLFLSTCKYAFLGDHEVFKDLKLNKNLDKLPKFPIIHISLSAGAGSVEELQGMLTDKIGLLCKEHKVNLTSITIRGRFEELIRVIYEKYNSQVAILIDEYDKPILDCDAGNKKEIRDELKRFYSVIKDCDSYLGFVFVTGVSRFNKVSLFSGLNNLLDISMSKDYAEICGYTEEELELIFKPELSNLSEQTRKKIKDYYNGFDFCGIGNHKMYNPDDIHKFFIEGSEEFKDFWVSTGSPTFLINLLKKKTQPIFLPKDIKVDRHLMFESFDIDDIPIEVLLFQTGYLTIKSVIKDKDSNSTIYALDFPNQSVESSFKFIIRTAYLKDSDSPIRIKLANALETFNFEKMVEAFNDQIFTHSYLELPKKTDEIQYSNIIHALISNLIPDLITSCNQESDVGSGRIELIVKLRKDVIIIFELKKDKSSAIALDQIELNQYARHLSNTSINVAIIGIGLNFNTKNRCFDSPMYKKLK